MPARKPYLCSSEERSQGEASLDRPMVRPERPEDIDGVRAIVVAAFERRDGAEPVEAVLLDELRCCSGWIPAYSLVAVVGSEVVGHVVCTRGVVDNIACLGLGPIAVSPAYQRAGVGSALIDTTIGIADRQREPLIALLGSPDYYARFGFLPSTSHAVRPRDPAWGECFQVRTLDTFDPSTVKGDFRYAEPFDQL